MSQFILKSLELENFKKHANLVLEFAENLNVIKGPNYAGKSTILHGLFCAFFGVSAVPGGKSVVVRKGAKNFSCTAKGQKGEQSVEINRTLNTAIVRVDGEMVASGHTGVNEWVEKNITYLDYKKTTLLSYGKQTQTAAILSLGAPALNRMIEDLSGADYIEKVIKRAADKAAKQEGIVDAIGDIEDSAPLKTAKIEKDRAEASATQQAGIVLAKIRPLEAAVAEQKAHLEESEAFNKRLEKASIRRAQILTEQATLTDEVERIEIEYNEIGEVDLLALTKAKDEAKEAEQSYNQAWSSVRMADDNKRKAKEQLASFVGYAEAEESIGRELKELNDKLEVELEQINLLVRQEASLGTAIREAKKLIEDSVCPACARPFDDHEAHKVKAERDLATFKAELASVTEKLGERNRTVASVKKLGDIKKAALPPKDWRERKAQWEERLVKDQAIIDSYNHLIFSDELKEKYAAKTEAARDAYAAGRAKLERRQTLEIRNDKAVARVDDLSRELAALPQGEPVDIGALREKWSNSLEELNTLKEQHRGFEAAAKDAARELSYIKQKLSDIEQATQRRDAAEKKARKYRGLQKWLRDNKTAFISEMWEGILALTSEITSMVTSGRVTEVRRSEDGEFSYVEDGTEFPIDCASGGQQAIMGIGLQLALSSLLPQGLRLIGLDEPSSELNDEHAAALAGALRTQDRQVILISHREGEEYSSENVIVLG